MVGFGAMEAWYHRARRGASAPGVEGGDFRSICAIQPLLFSVERRVSVVLKRQQIALGAPGSSRAASLDTGGPELATADLDLVKILAAPSCFFGSSVEPEAPRWRSEKDDLEVLARDTVRR